MIIEELEVNDPAVDVFNGFGVRVKLNTSFHRVREFLSRMGIANYQTKTITQSCHIFHKRGEYAIMHFLEMLQFDGREANFSQTDEDRRDYIVHMLKEWGLLEIIDDDVEKPSVLPKISVIKKEILREENWTQVQKYTIGK